MSEARPAQAPPREQAALAQRMRRRSAAASFTSASKTRPWCSEGQEQQQQNTTRRMDTIYQHTDRERKRSCSILAARVKSSAKRTAVRRCVQLLRSTAVPAALPSIAVVSCVSSTDRLIDALPVFSIVSSAMLSGFGRSGRDALGARFILVEVGHAAGVSLLVQPRLGAHLQGKEKRRGETKDNVQHTPWASVSNPR